MPSARPSEVPPELRAGDTVTWLRSLPDRPASAGWELKYTLVGAAGVKSFAATAEGEDHRVTVTAGTTRDWSAGPYTLVEYVEHDGERFTLGDYAVRVMPNLAEATGALDTRSHAQRVLDNLNAWLEGKSATAGEMQLDGRRVRHHSLAELLALRDRYAAMVANELGGNKGLVRRMLVNL